MKIISKVHAIIFPVITVLTFGAQGGHAATLNLLGVGWNKPNVTVLIKAGKGITPEAVADVGTAVSDWVKALQSVEGAPTLTLVQGVKIADIVIRMRVGGGAVLGQALPKTTSPFSCALNSVSIQLSGKAFGQRFSDAGTQNVARHELGHALGLGHSDDPSDLMYAAAESSEIFGDLHVGISQCDEEGIDAIYSLLSYCEIPASVSCP